LVEIQVGSEKLPGSRCGDGLACRVKILETTLWWNISGAAKKKIEQGRVRRRKLETLEMTFTGTLIDELMATVERAEQRAQADDGSRAEGATLKASADGTRFVRTPLTEAALVEPWFASVQKNSEFDSKFLGVA
jgi:hypothetical protein